MRTYLRRDLIRCLIKEGYIRHKSVGGWEEVARHDLSRRLLCIKAISKSELSSWLVKVLGSFFFRLCSFVIYTARWRCLNKATGRHYTALMSVSGLLTLHSENDFADGMRRAVYMHAPRTLSKSFEHIQRQITQQTDNNPHYVSPFFTFSFHFQFTNPFHPFFYPAMCTRHSSNLIRLPKKALLHVYSSQTPTPLPFHAFNTFSDPWPLYNTV